jgi:molybdopterin synthase catalytic subunit
VLKYVAPDFRKVPSNPQGILFNMQVRVLYFGALKDIFLKDRDTVDLPSGATVATLLEHYRRIEPGQGNFWEILAIAVNQEYAQSGHLLRDGDEIALLPPVSGGTSEIGVHCELVRETIHTNEVVAALKHGEDGAVVIFDGIVRDNTRGRKTLYLDYEAYESMALDQMRKLAQSAIVSYSVREVALLHRLGRIEIGETSVLIAVASAHRAQAFDACRWIIDTLKKTVPIWKREFFADGAVWSAGEPFPAEISISIAAQKDGR